MGLSGFIWVYLGLYGFIWVYGHDIIVFICIHAGFLSQQA